MLYAIISDIHANESALRRALADAKACGAERIACLGDVVGYGPLPAETLALVRASAAVSIAGNHDDAVSGRIDASDFIDLAGEAVARHREALSTDDLAWLRALPRTAAIEGAALAHGDFTDPAAFKYVESEQDALANFEATDAAIAFVGHTHVPALFLVGRSGTVYRTEPQDFSLEDGKRYIVNPGSVGYPREAHGECRSSYVLYDSTERTVRFRFLPFSVASVMQRGAGPRRARLRTLAAVGAAGALAVGGGVFWLTPKTEVVNRVEVTEVRVAEDPALRVAAKTLQLGPGARKVRAGLELRRRSDPVVLTVRFLDAQGHDLDRFSDTVKKSSSRAIPVPRGATAAEFAVTRVRADDAPALERFAPAAE